jgi:hypothetical protein
MVKKWQVRKISSAEKLLALSCGYSGIMLDQHETVFD